MVLRDVETTPLSAPQFSVPQFMDCFAVETKHFKVKKIQGKLLWRWGMESKLRTRAALSHHIKTIFKKTSLTNSSGPRERSRYAPLLNVGVMCDSYTCTIDLPAESIGLMTQRGVGIQLCCYPTDFGRK